MNTEKLIRKYDKQARTYEMRRRNRTERAWRERLIRCAEGRVLELSVGAGANFPFYPKEAEVVAVDFSGEMLAKAREGAAENGIRASFIRSDVESLSFPDDSFDTIVSTLSFCGYENPDLVLHRMQRWCKPGGRLLFMEHGISSNRLVGLLQKIADPLFKAAVGCHLKRDIVRMLEHSRANIGQMERHMMGAVYLVWAAPHK